MPDTDQTKPAESRPPYLDEILSMITDGETPTSIINNYPNLTVPDIQAAVQYAYTNKLGSGMNHVMAGLDESPIHHLNTILGPTNAIKTITIALFNEPIVESPLGAPIAIAIAIGVPSSGMVVTPSQALTLGTKLINLAILADTLIPATAPGIPDVEPS